MYNLGTGKGTSVLEMVAAFENASGKVCFEIFRFHTNILHDKVIISIWGLRNCPMG